MVTKPEIAVERPAFKVPHDRWGNREDLMVVVDWACEHLSTLPEDDREAEHVLITVVKDLKMAINRFRPPVNYFQHLDRWH